MVDRQGKLGGAKIGRRIDPEIDHQAEEAIDVVEGIYRTEIDAAGTEGGEVARRASFLNRKFTVRNPFERSVEISLEAVLPDFLMRRGWSVRFLDPAGDSFSLSPRGSRTVVFTLVPGADFKATDVPAGAAALIEIHTCVDGLLIGGMSYQVDPSLKTLPRG